MVLCQLGKEATNAPCDDGVQWPCEFRPFCDLRVIIFLCFSTGMLFRYSQRYLKSFNVHVDSIHFDLLRFITPSWILTRKRVFDYLLFRECADELCYQLCIIFLYFPEMWKASKLLPSRCRITDWLWNFWRRS